MSVSDEPAPPVPFGLRGGGNGPPAGQTLRRAGEGRTAGCTQFAGAPLSAPGHSFRGPVRRAVSSRSARRGGEKTFDVFVESAHSLLVLICREGRRYECRKAASFAGPTADGVPAGAGVSVARRTGNRAGSAGRSSPPRKYFFGNADAGRTDAAPAVVEAENNKMIRTTEIQTDQ